MKRGLRMHLVFTCSLLLGFLTTSAQNTYYANYGANWYDAGLISPSMDNAFYGVTRHGTGDTLYCYKVDQMGQMLWKTAMPLSTPMVPTSISVLSEDGFAFLATQFTNATVVMRVGDDGQLLWRAP